jgi:predicted AlkP superfamily phosphohydrolase/phosphomutase
MAITSGLGVASIVSSAIHATIKNEIRQRFVEMITKDIEPILEEYTKQIVTRVYEMKDPYSMDGLKIDVTFKLPEMK